MANATAGERLREALAKRDTSKRERRERFNEWRTTRNRTALPAKPAGYVDHMHPLRFHSSPALLAFDGPQRTGALSLPRG